MKSYFFTFVSAACVLFTVFMAISFPFAYYFSGPSLGLNISLGFLIAALAAALFQFLWFTEAVIKKMRYPLRLLGFFFTFGATLFAIGWLGNWFPHSLEAIGLFFVIFAVIFALTSLGYTIYFRRSAGSYDKALAAYRKQQERDA
jgi:hypothetical protein